MKIVEIKYNWSKVNKYLKTLRSQLVTEMGNLIRLLLFLHINLRILCCLRNKSL